jgi:hypothetical protein
MDLDQLPAFFDAPAHWPVNPDSAAASERTLAWAKQTRMVNTPEAVKLLRAWDFGGITGASYPRARGEGLQDVTDWVTWGIIFDDTFSGIIKDPAKVAAVIRETIEVLCTPADQLTRPLRGADRGLADLMQRYRQRMSPVWLARFQASMQDYFSGVLHKSLAACGSEPIDLDLCLAIRRADVAMIPPMDLIEAYEGFELPESVYGTPQMRRLRLLVAEGIVIQNDVVSLARDRRDWDLNVVTVLEEAHGASPKEALLRARDLYRERVAEFKAVSAQLFQTCAAMGLSATEQEQVRLVVADMQDLFPGICHGYLICARYLQNLKYEPNPTGPDFMHEFTEPAAPEPGPQQAQQTAHDARAAASTLRDG